MNKKFSHELEAMNLPTGMFESIMTGYNSLFETIQGVKNINAHTGSPNGQYKIETDSDDININVLPFKDMAHLMKSTGYQNASEAKNYIREKMRNQIINSARGRAHNEIMQENTMEKVLSQLVKMEFKRLGNGNLTPDDSQESRTKQARRTEQQRQQQQQSDSTPEPKAVRQNADDELKPANLRSIVRLSDDKQSYTIVTKERYIRVRFTKYKSYESLIKKCDAEDRDPNEHLRSVYRRILKHMCETHKDFGDRVCNYLIKKEHVDEDLAVMEIQRLKKLSAQKTETPKAEEKKPADSAAAQTNNSGATNGAYKAKSSSKTGLTITTPEGKDVLIGWHHAGTKGNLEAIVAKYKAAIAKKIPNMPVDEVTRIATEYGTRIANYLKKHTGSKKNGIKTDKDTASNNTATNNTTPTGSPNIEQLTKDDKEKYRPSRNVGYYTDTEQIKMHGFNPEKYPILNKLFKDGPGLTTARENHDGTVILNNPKTPISKDQFVDAANDAGYSCIRDTYRKKNALAIDGFIAQNGFDAAEQVLAQAKNAKPESSTPRSRAAHSK